ncbi:hypothetical protein [Streptomyces hesseae]|uniref:MarR family transcriptional regulator n=1 Tax=Streptomyces hesseae TaxID=3075519 RepID=A0ABU2SY54_9ACTN|nr:hypothetical protein [Streptomyces sp. DSM 40473]MDT0453787.1 hypothetical protein [Streptomyces sp. DSM 40473]
MPNEIIRHPRLSSDAVRLLTWALSLPDEGLEPLSKTAKRAGIGKSAFTRAKRELVAEGFVHEWRRQGDGGRWVTEQMISNVPLTAVEAAAARDGRPSVPSPAAGEPNRPAVGRSPKKTEKKNYNPPTPGPAPVVEPEPVADEVPVAAEREGEDLSTSMQSSVCTVPPPLVERGGLALAAIAHVEPRLRLSGRDVAKLAVLAGEWFQRGGGMSDLREALVSGLPEVVHSPGALVCNRLTRKMPTAPTFAELREADRRATAEPRVGGMRECAGEHTQPRLFRPVDAETLCPTCHSDAEAGVAAAINAAVRGGAAVRELLHARRAGVAA